MLRHVRDHAARPDRVSRKGTLTMPSQPSQPSGLSVWDAELLKHLTEHLETEADLLASYQRLTEESQSEYVSYLMALLVEDEARHHRLFGELVNALRAPVERDVGTMVPTVGTVANPQELLELTNRFLEAERKDARELKRMSRGLRLMRGLSLWPLLVELMERDTEKHQTILRFIRGRVRDQLR